MASLYRKYRPIDFNSVVGQNDIVNNLLNQIKDEHISHAYEFSGTRGTGKTSTAKIFARAVNCLEPKNGEPCNKCSICESILKGNCLDVFEIDAASNNGVDNIRSLKESIIYPPSEARYKVYIIDEVHMLSQGAFNALLKTLEEPPSYVIFILATTESHKIPATIRSRCQKFQFKRVTTVDMLKRMDYICTAEGVTVDEDALQLIALNSDGAVRDSLSILDQCISLYKDNINKESIANVLGLTDKSFTVDMITNLISKNVNESLCQIHNIVQLGKDLRIFIVDMISIFRDLMLFISSKNASLIDGLDEYKNTISQLSTLTNFDEINFIIRELSSLNSQVRYDMNPLTSVELFIIRICNPIDDSLGDLKKKIFSLEKEIEDLKSNILFNSPNIPSINAYTDIIEPCKDTTLSYKELLSSKNEILKELINHSTLSIKDNILFISFVVPAHYLIATTYSNLDIDIDYKFVLNS